jgi:hypothetical protein
LTNLHFDQSPFWPISILTNLHFDQSPFHDTAEKFSD